MRFPAVTPRDSGQEPVLVPAAPATDLLRRLFGADLLVQARPAAEAEAEIPFDLDQRVRLAGEW